MGVTTSSNSAVTYEPIATTTLGSAAASYTFSSIPNTYTDLVLVIIGATTDTGVSNLEIQFNGDTGSNYSSTRLLGDGSSASSGRLSNSSYSMIGDVNNNQFVSINNIMNYANTTTYKTHISRTGSAANYLGAYVGLWRSTAAINSVTIKRSGTTITAGTTLSLYGIKAA